MVENPNQEQVRGQQQALVGLHDLLHGQQNRSVVKKKRKGVREDDNMMLATAAERRSVRV